MSLNFDRYYASKHSQSKINTEIPLQQIPIVPQGCILVGGGGGGGGITPVREWFQNFVTNLI